MAEEAPSHPAEMAEADTPIPPIDNIHNIFNSEPDLPAPISNDPRLQPPSHIAEQTDTEMPEAAPSFIPQIAPAPPNTTAQAQAQAQVQAQRTATPTRHINGTTDTVPPPMPLRAASHGAPARRFLNEKVTGVLLEGLKRLAADQPENPLHVLGEFLLQRSRELERTT